MASRDLSNVAASCFTGATVIAITNPLDCLKQRWQVAQTSTRTPLLAFAQEIVRAEGAWRGLWYPGLLSNCLACTISVGTRIGLYPRLRDSFSAGKSGTTMGMLASGLAGGALGYVVSAPFFFASRVAQAEAGIIADGVLITGACAGRAPSVADPGGLATLHYLWSTHGLGALWKGASVLVARGAVLSSTQLTTYDLSKRQLVAAGVEDGPLVHSAASVLASVMLTTAICPLDVVLTTYQAGPSIGRPYTNAWEAACGLVSAGGPAALMRGWLPLWARFLPSSVLTFFIFEQTRKLLLGAYLD
tara:strand:- start:526 stop:1434 length:909 start_codon:yes stop_codon:yes gene_type:complete